MDLNSLQQKKLLDASGAFTNTNSLLLDNINKNKLLNASGVSTFESLDLSSNKTSRNKKELEDANRNFFQNLLGNIIKK